MHLNLRPALIVGLGILGMFVLGLSIPRISDLAVFALFAVGAWTTLDTSRLQAIDTLTSLLLTAFLVAFFVPSAWYGFTDPLTDLKDGFVLLLFYGSGLLWGRRTKDGIQGTWVLLALISGFTIFGALTTFTNPAKVATFLNPDRSAPNFWSPGDTVNGTVLGLYASLGLCLLPAALLWRTADGKHHSLVRAGLLLVGGLGFASNLAMQNRSPYFALGLAFLACTLIYFQKSGGSLAKRVGGFLLRISPLLVGCLVIVIAFPDLATDLIFRRFGEQGGDTGGRVQAWVSVLQNLSNQPFGGKTIHLGGPLYAHNFWMDAAYNSGFLALLTLLLFHLAHLPSILRFYRRNLPALEVLAVSTIGASMFVGCMVEPILDASRLYLGATCFLLAWVKARAQAPMSSTTSA